MRVAANLSIMFQRVDLLQRYEKAAAMGFRCVEVSLPYALPAEKLKAEADRLKLEHILINSPPGDWSKGDRGIAAIPMRKKDFTESLEIAVKYANTLACKKIHVMAGVIGVNDETKLTYVENIRAASRRFAKDDITCLIEPINHISIPGYFLSSYEQGHVQVAQVPDRHEPDSEGEINYDYAFKALKKHGDWDVGCEYSERGDTADYVKWVHTYPFLPPPPLLPYSLSLLLPPTCMYKIGHVQVAQVPDRHEPDSEGEINYDYVFKALKKHGDWDVGCEYSERGDTADYVKWAHTYGLTFA
ncbi:Putative hydroxypyruvate isomerase [Toxocara canis]|uniref:Putative hydroxypyruvate isomerase n=1 Tax=Toxocara canis TaxID=6265 RepID=A0A0B2UX41_TOXCA|nr:Putative hydroxypyruvate isomerase [Toxocara canis]